MTSCWLVKSRVLSHVKGSECLQSLVWRLLSEVGCHQRHSNRRNSNRSFDTEKKLQVNHLIWWTHKTNAELRTFGEQDDRFGPSSLRLILPKGRGSYKASVSSRKKSGDQITSFGAHTVQALVIQKGFAESIALFLRSAMLTHTQWHSWKLPSTTTVWSAGHWAAPLEHLWIKGLAKAKY